MVPLNNSYTVKAKKKKKKKKKSFLFKISASFLTKEKDVDFVEYLATGAALMTLQTSLRQHTQPLAHSRHEDEKKRYSYEGVHHASDSAVRSLGRYVTVT